MSRPPFAQSEAQAISERFIEQQHLSLTTQLEEIDLPNVRIKRIMKQDSCEPNPRMVAADAIPLMAFATQVLIGEITVLAYELMVHKENRRTLQLRDVLAAVNSMGKFDFLIDVVNEVKAREDGLGGGGLPGPYLGPRPNAEAGINLACIPPHSFGGFKPLVSAQLPRHGQPAGYPRAWMPSDDVLCARDDKELVAEKGAEDINLVNYLISDDILNMVNEHEHLDDILGSLLPGDFGLS